MSSSLTFLSGWGGGTVEAAITKSITSVRSGYETEPDVYLCLYLKVAFKENLFTQRSYLQRLWAAFTSQVLQT